MSASRSLTLPIPFGTTMPNSVAKPRKALTSIVRCLISRARTECSDKTLCCFASLVGTNFASGREAASQMAAASAASFFFPFFTNGLTASGAINRVSCPSAAMRRDQ
jgi:hypothetical protein